MKSNLLTPVAQRLLSSKIPARLAFVGANGDPHIAPIWFLWRHERFLLCNRANGFKVKAIRKQPRVALSIDSETTPYESLRVRGIAEIEVIDGIPVEYIECENRHYGNAKGQQWIDWVCNSTNQMARISLMPDRVEAHDFRERFPQNFG